MEIVSKMETSQNTDHDPDICSAEDNMEECWPSGATDAVPGRDFWYEAWVPNANQISLTYRSKQQKCLVIRKLIYRLTTLKR